ncbi:hypothetical protein [Allorhodopirellula solitaria]|uniref:Uncharacterized protein n=1 Tax=Allorhodopirellula solitaria TaxID=2527987 RepID=A0A5C5YIW7_9BACT|nr:hypothetical protein [Allorhodopirellula solitaria]TWT74807.1 hypothetical protein CA85_00930 [Allorhodopirellula solitaria]
MATFNPKHFTDADVLRTIHPEHLCKLIEPHATYFGDRGLSLPSARQAATLDVDRLAHLLESPDDAIPQELLNAIGYIDEMATERGMDSLLPKAIEAKMPLDPNKDHSPADIAVQVWLFDPMIVEREHIWFTWKPPRRMDCFRVGEKKHGKLLEITHERCQQAAEDIGSWLSENNRTPFCNLAYRETDDGFEFSIQRGDPFTRKSTIERNSIGNVHFRPAGKDKVIFKLEDVMVMINTPIRRAIAVYQRVFGNLLYGDPEFFTDSNIISTRALEELGEGALSCRDVDGIDEVLFVEYLVDLGGDQDATVTYKANDIITDMKQRNRKLDFEGRLISATFRIRYRGSRYWRTLKLYDGNATCYTRDANARHAEQWMRLRNFIQVTNANAESDVEVNDETLALH